MASLVMQWAALQYCIFQTTRRDISAAVSGLVFPLLTTALLVGIWFLTTTDGRFRRHCLRRDRSLDGKAVTKIRLVVEADFTAITPLINKTGVDLAPLLNHFPSPSIPPFSLFPSTSAVDTAFLDVAYDNSTGSYERIYGGYQISSFNASMPSLSATVLFNATASYSLPVWTNMLTNAFLSQVYRLEQQEISVYSQPLPNANNLAYTFILYGPMLVQYGLVFLIPYFGVVAIKERENGVQHSIYMTGVSRLTYWSSHMTFHYILYLIPSMISVLVTYFSGISPFSQNPFLATLLLYLLFGLTVPPSGYCLQFLFSSSQTAMKYLYPATSLLSFLPYVISMIYISVEGNADIPLWMSLILSVSPPYALYFGITTLSSAYFFDGGLTNSNMWSFSIGLTPIYLLLLAETVVLLLLTAVLDVYVGRGLDQLPFCAVSQEDMNLAADRSKVLGGDSDVIAEEQRVAALGQGDPHHSVVVRNVWKAYKGDSVKVADRDISLSIPSQGQCFGLLGPNGAGKTTLVDILTGKTAMSRGSVEINGAVITSNAGGAFRDVSVCPQHDVLLDLMTVDEHIKFFAMLKGIPREALAAACDEAVRNMSKWLDLVAVTLIGKTFRPLVVLEDHRGKLSKALSGGNKRKLSVALAFLGNPKVVFLDEPSTGMDPHVRRKLWEIIKRGREGRAVILTTHSMEEADFLCDRIGIMIDGRLRCLGSAQHLKSQYGSGYQLSIKCDAQRMDDVERFVESTFEGASRENSVGGTIWYQLPVGDTSKLRLSRIFSEIQAHKADLEIVDFLIAQPTLEQVFLKFAAESLE